MTRKHYIKLGKLMAEANKLMPAVYESVKAHRGNHSKQAQSVKAGMLVMYDYLLQGIEEVMLETNPRFDTEKFEQYISKLAIL